MWRMNRWAEERRRGGRMRMKVTGGELDRADGDQENEERRRADEDERRKRRRGGQMRMKGAGRST